MENKRLTRRSFLKGVIGGVSSLTGLAAWPKLAVAQPAIKIGTSLPLTGVFAIAGRKHKDGYLFWSQFLNKDKKRWLLGRPIELIISDNRSNTEAAVAQFERFINLDKVDLLFGTFSSKLTFPTSAVAEKNKMVYPVPSGGALKIWKRGFQHIFYFQQNAAEYIGLAPVGAVVGYKERGLIKAQDFPKTAGVVHADDFFANAIAAGLVGERGIAPGFLAQAGIKLVFRQKWPEGFTDWITRANSITAKKPDFLLAGTASPDEAIQLVRAFQTVGYNPKGLYMSQGTQVEFKEALGDAANGIMIHSAWHPAAPFVGLLANEKYSNRQFIAGFRKQFRRDPDEDEAIPLAVCQGMEQAVRATRTTDNTKLQSWLASRTKEKPVRTVLGKFHWDKRGLPIGRPHLLLQWHKGDLDFVWPLGEFPGTKDLLWPKPAWPS
ncbi:MAG: amino acid ABC transporter substrate-binding protein [Candidatus Binatia bacterium]